MKKVFSVVILGVSIVIAVFLWIEKGPHKVVFANTEAGTIYANQEIEIIYTKFCVSSPCGSQHMPRTIYSGTTNESGSIILWGHSAKEIGYGYQFGRIIEYTIHIDGKEWHYMDKERSTNTIIYLSLDEVR